MTVLITVLLFVQDMEEVCNDKRLLQMLASSNLEKWPLLVLFMRDNDDPCVRKRPVMTVFGTKDEEEVCLVEGQREIDALSRSGVGCD